MPKTTLVRLKNLSKCTYNGIKPGGFVNVSNPSTYLVHGFKKVEDVIVEKEDDGEGEGKGKTLAQYKKMKKDDLIAEVEARELEEKGVELEGDEKVADLAQLLFDDDQGKFDEEEGEE